MNTRLRVASALFVGVLHLTAAAQTPPSKAPAKPPAAEPQAGTRGRAEQTPEPALLPDQQQALALLNELFTAAQEIKDEKAGIKIQAQVADTLWRWDEERARLLFEKAFNAIGVLKQRRISPDAPRLLAELSDKFQLRSEVLGMISARDPELAQRLMKVSSKAEDATEPNATAGGVQSAATGDNGAQAALYLRLAALLVGSDLPRAAALTQQSFAYGLHPSLAGVLDLIRRKDAKTADNLCAAAISSPLRDAGGQTTFINYLGPYVLPGFGQGNSRPSAAPGATFNQPLAKQFLETAYAAVARQTPQQLAGLPFDRAIVNYMTVRALLPYFALYLPEKSGAASEELTRRAARINSEDLKAVDALTDSADVAELMDEAGSAHNTDLQDSLYAKAATLASTHDDPEKAFAASSKIGDPDLRAGLNTMISFRAANRAIKDGDADAAYLYAKGLTSISHQAYVYGQLANLWFVRKKDAQRAVEILNEARKLVESDHTSSEAERVRAALLITAAMSRVDAPLGFEFEQFAVKLMNASGVDLNTPAPTELKFVELVNTSLGLNRFNLEESFSTLAGSDSWRAIQLARSIENKEAATLAQLAAVKGTLAKARPQPVAIAQTRPKPPGGKGNAAPLKESTPDADPLKQLARAFVARLSKEDFYGAAENFDGTMMNVMPPEKLREVWGSLVAQVGPFRQEVAARASKVEQFDVVLVECEFESAHLNVRVVFNSDKQITGLFFQPAQR